MFLLFQTWQKHSNLSSTDTCTHISLPLLFPSAHKLCTLNIAKTKYSRPDFGVAEQTSGMLLYRSIIFRRLCACTYELYNEIQKWILLEWTIWLNQKLKDNGNNGEGSEWMMPVFICDIAFRMPFQCQHISLFQIKWLSLWLSHIRWLGVCAFSTQILLDGRFLFHFRVNSNSTSVTFYDSNMLATDVNHCTAQCPRHCIFYRNHQNGHLWLMVAYVFVRMVFVSLFDARCPFTVKKCAHLEINLKRVIRFTAYNFRFWYRWFSANISDNTFRIVTVFLLLRSIFYQCCRTRN